jgi:hypothetical protein
MPIGMNERWLNPSIGLSRSRIPSAPIISKRFNWPSVGMATEKERLIEIEKQLLSTFASEKGKINKALDLKFEINFSIFINVFPLGASAGLLTIFPA